MKPILEVKDLRVTYPGQTKLFGGSDSDSIAVRGISFKVHSNQVFALVGESGSGKSSTGRALVGLVPAAGGEAWFRPSEARIQADARLAALMGRFGRDGALNLLTLPAKEWKPLRPLVSLIFQDSRAALNPRMKVGDSIAEPLLIHRRERGSALQEQVRLLMEKVELDPSLASRLPAKLSGGQRQRACIARALALGPELVICDEMVSALDVLVQNRILSLLTMLQKEAGTSFLFITHDLAIVSGFADCTAVMKSGRLLEVGETSQVFQAPEHEYTRTLLDSVPRLNP
ncbi:MAG: ATP-binding cassette domain-containing protein [Planctomycetota bacterium]|nr:ATP-binding cassette domain-containing protein [Planctomycetota bacterium]